LAVNLFGYGDTTPWPENAVQTLADHADLVLALCSNSRGPVFIVGHSFGGSVALKAALRLGHKVAGLVLLGRNSFLRIGESHGFSKSLVRLFLTKLKKLQRRAKRTRFV
jgi:pimeloyl-ACP methyl ester carboxylesterase